MSEGAGPKQRVSAVRFPESYELPAGPATPTSEAQDAFRQSQFLLRSDLRLFESGMGLQIRFANEASHSSFRTHPYAALIGLWSRTFLSLADGCPLVIQGSYGSSLPLLRATVEYLAAQQRLLVGEMPLFLEWLGGSLSPNEEHKAIDLGLGRFPTGEALATDDHIGAVFRQLSDLSDPNFGATLLLVGPESNHQRLALVFADQAFHFGWAQLTLGWLLCLCERQITFVAAAEEVFGGGDERRADAAAFARRVQEALAQPERCRIEEVEDDGARRNLLHNFRRTPGGAAKKVLL